MKQACLFDAFLPAALPAELASDLLSAAAAAGSREHLNHSKLSGHSEHWQAFDAWLESRVTSGEICSEATAVLYKEMWGSFAHWCLEQSPPLGLACVSSGDLQRFQASRLSRAELSYRSLQSPDEHGHARSGRLVQSGAGVRSDSSDGANGSNRSNRSIGARHAFRLLRLINQVLEHHAQVCESVVNMAAKEAIEDQPDVRYACAGVNDGLPQALCVGDANRLIGFLSMSRSGTGTSTGTSAATLDWQVLRNRTAAALQLGAGLGPVEVRLLTLVSIVGAEHGHGQSSRQPLDQPINQYVNRPVRLLVPATGESLAHEAPMAPWASELLEQWLRVRAEEGIPGPWLFPAVRSGRPWGKVAQYKAVRGVLLDAGLALPGGGSFVLRHTFALRQLKHGTNPAQLAQWMGVREDKVMSRYARRLALLEEVV